MASLRPDLAPAVAARSACQPLQQLCQFGLKFCFPLCVQGHCWVLADNEQLEPPHVIDSRSFGPLPLSNVVGRCAEPLGSCWRLAPALFLLPCSAPCALLFAVTHLCRCLHHAAFCLLQDSARGSQRDRPRPSFLSFHPRLSHFLTSFTQLTLQDSVRGPQRDTPWPLLPSVPSSSFTLSSPTQLHRRILYAARSETDHGPVENSAEGMEADVPVLEAELDLERLCRE